MKSMSNLLFCISFILSTLACQFLQPMAIQEVPKIVTVQVTVEVPVTVNPNNLPPTPVQYQKIVYVNNCNRTIVTAVHYKNLEGNWVTDKWFTINPGESAYVATTTDDMFYHYGTTEDGELTWQGDYVLKLEDNKLYGFKDVNMHVAQWGGTFYYNWACP